MGLPYPKLAIFAALVVAPTQALAGSVVFRTTPVFQAPIQTYRPSPVYRSVPTFRAPSGVYHMGTASQSSSSSLHQHFLGRSDRLDPLNPWAGMPPQIRSRPVVGLGESAVTPALSHGVSSAETDLLRQLHVSPADVRASTFSPTGTGLGQRTAIAIQAETDMLKQLKAPQLPTAATIVVLEQQKVASAQSAESTLLKGLQSSSQISTIRGSSLSQGYSFSPTSDGTIQVFQNGRLIGTGSLTYAQSYGYQGPAPTPASASASLSSSSSPTTAVSVAGRQSNYVEPANSAATIADAKTPVTPTYQSASVVNDLNGSVSAPSAGSAPLTPIKVATTTIAGTSVTQQAGNQIVNAVKAPSNFYQSNPVGQITVDALASAGGAVDKIPTAGGGLSKVAGLNALSYTSEAISRTTLIEQKRYAEIPANLTSFVGSTLASNSVALLATAPVYAAPLASATFTASFDLGQRYVAPYAGPLLGDRMYSVDPNFWIPASNPKITNIPTTVWTGVQSNNSFSLPGPN